MCRRQFSSPSSLSSLQNDVNAVDVFGKTVYMSKASREEFGLAEGVAASTLQSTLTFGQKTKLAALVMREDCPASVLAS